QSFTLECRDRVVNASLLSGTGNDVADEGEWVADAERTGGEEGLTVLHTDLPSPVSRERLEDVAHARKVGGSRALGVVELSLVAVQRGEPVLDMIRHVDDERRRRAGR